jgi:hypothetical protein
MGLCGSFDQWFSNRQAGLGNPELVERSGHGYTYTVRQSFIAGGGVKTKQRLSAVLGGTEPAACLRATRRGWVILHAGWVTLTQNALLTQ